MTPEPFEYSVPTGKIVARLVLGALPLGLFAYLIIAGVAEDPGERVAHYAAFLLFLVGMVFMAHDLRDRRPVLWGDESGLRVRRGGEYRTIAWADIAGLECRKRAVVVATRAGPHGTLQSLKIETSDLPATARQVYDRIHGWTLHMEGVSDD